MKIINIIILITLVITSITFSQSSRWEAEDMAIIDSSNVYVFGTYVGIYNNGGVQFWKRFDDGIYEISVRALEMAAGDEHARLLVENGKSVSFEFEVKSLIDSIYVDTLVVDDGNNWKLVFTNDHWIPDVMDRNLYIDYIEFTYIEPYVPIDTTVVDTTVTRHDSVKVAWNANSEDDLRNYSVYYGINSRLYSQKVGGVIDTFKTIVDNFTVNIPYYFAVTATDTASNESAYSAEVEYIFTSVSGDSTAPDVLFIEVTPIFED